MTCIVAIPHDGKVTFASDSAAIDDADIVFSSAPKVVTVDVGLETAAIAMAGDSALLPMLRWDIEWPPPPAFDDHDAGDRWAQAIANVLTEAAVEANIVDKKRKIDGTVLLAFRGRLWALEHMYADPIDTTIAIGSGAPFAFGALAVLATTKNTPRKRAKRAVEVACRYSPYCRLPVLMVEV